MQVIMHAVGAVLGQTKNKFFHVIDYASKVLNEKCIEVFMDDFSIFGSSFDICMSNLDTVLK